MKILVFLLFLLSPAGSIFHWIISFQPYSIHSYIPVRRLSTPQLIASPARMGPYLSSFFFPSASGNLLKPPLPSLLIPPLLLSFSSSFHLTPFPSPHHLPLTPSPSPISHTALSPIPPSLFLPLVLPHTLPQPPFPSSRPTSSNPPPPPSLSPGSPPAPPIRRLLQQ